MKYRRSTAVATATAVALVLTACGTPPWAQGSSSSASPSPTPSVSPSSAVPTPVPNDLSSGSTQRTLTAGPVTATINYFSTLSMDKWMPSMLKPLSISLVTTIVPDDGQKVYLQVASMVATPFDGAQALAPLAAQTDSSTVNPGYLVLSPYSYSQTFNVGQLPAEADRVSLAMRYDFLVQTTPTSSEYAKQTASDTVTVAITPE